MSNNQPSITVEEVYNLTPEKIMQLDIKASNTAKKLDKSLNYYEMQIDNLINHAIYGYTGAQLVLGLRYFKGSGVEQSNGKAYAWFYVSAKYNNHEGMYYLGVCQLKGIGVTANASLGMQTLEKAANLGNLEATQFLYSTYIQGDKKEQQKAISIVKKAADVHKIDEACYILGRMYLKGKNVNQNINEAVKYYEKCYQVTNNGKLICVCANDLLDVDFNKYKKDIYKYIKKSEELNYPEAFFYHAMLIIKENKYPIDYKTAYSLLQKAKAGGVNATELDNLITILNKNVCPNCHQKFTLQEKTGIFGKKYICTHCNKSWKK